MVVAETLRPARLVCNDGVQPGSGPALYCARAIGAEGTRAVQRTPEQLRNHYEVEKALADRLKATRTQAERAEIYSTMYDELFARVPDHPRLTVQKDPAADRRQVQAQLRLLRPWLGPGVEYVEFGAGSCALAFAVCPRVRRARAIEIADQVPADAAPPANFDLVLYDGYHLDLDSGSVDLVFSNQFVEHLHPDDASHHFEVVHRMLRAGGRYVLTTPQRWTGPHDVSRSFSETPRGFHLKEWSYGDLLQETRRLGFRAAGTRWTARGRYVPTPVGLVLAAEGVVSRLPLVLRRSLGHRLLPLVVLVLEK